jgi:hypothetical protein
MDEYERDVGMPTIQGVLPFLSIPGGSTVQIITFAAFREQVTN